MAGAKEWIFDASPTWLKGYLLGVYSWHHARQKYGIVYRNEVAALRARMMLNPEELRVTQRELLGDFLVSVFEANAFYRAMMEGRNIDPGVIKNDPERSLRSLDLMEKSFLKDNISAISSEGLDTFAITNTSGTSGSPMVVPYDAAGYQRGFAYWRRFYDTMGLGDSFRNARFSGRVLLSRTARTRKFWVEDWYERRLFLSTYHMTEDNLRWYVAELNRYQPHLIDGYPSALAILARFMLSTGARFTFKPIAAATTAETLSEQDRAAMEIAFGCKVYNQYASSEGAPPITECRAGALHLNTDAGFFEFFDVLGSTDVKELVVTSFRNTKLPLIRYRIGDSAQIGRSEACGCGSPFPTISRIEGRLDDLLYSSERGTIGRLDPIYKGVSGILSSQIIQEGDDDFRILLVPGTDYSPRTLEVLERNFRERVGFSVRVAVEAVDSIPLGPNGKFRAVVNRSRGTSST